MPPDRDELTGSRGQGLTARDQALTGGARTPPPADGPEPSGPGGTPAGPRRTVPLSHIPGAARWIYRHTRTYAGALTVLIAMCIYLTATQPFFLTGSNIFNVLAGNSDLLLISVGLTFAILSAGFDLSVGALASATGLVLYEVLALGAPAWVAVLAALALGAVFGGVVNGLLIGKFKLNFFVVTLGTMTLVFGLIDVITNGQTETISAPGFFAAIGNNNLAGVPIPVWICLVAVILAALVLNHTTFGRAVYAVGGNAEAARLSGINVTLVIFLIYAVAGFAAGLAGVVDASRLSSVAPTAGTTLTLTAAAAVLLGGTSFFGGIGGVAGTVVGVLLISVLQN
ncbi:MAG: ABC transporter permease, partial [Trebonia sp.]